MRFRALLAFAGLLFVQAISYSQYNTNFINYSNTGRCVSASLEFDVGSSNMNSEMVQRLMFGGYINDKLKEASSRNLKASNNFGLFLNYDASAFLKGGKKFDYLIGFKGQEILNATYSRDFYNLMFYGNQSYKGKTASLANCNVNALRFQEMKFGVIMHKVDSIAKIGVCVSVLKGEQLFYVSTNDKSSLYTSDDGDQIIFNSNFSLALSDTNNKRVSGFNGIGASADLFFETPYKSAFGKNCLLLVNANNIGFIHWWENSVQYSSDSSLSFSGYQVRTVYDLKDSTLNRINSDSLLRNLANARTENFNVNIPTNLVIVNKIYFTRGFCFNTGFRYVFNANYHPYFFLEPEFKYKQMVMALHAGYGGYVRLNFGASVTWNSKNWFLRVGSNSLQGFIAPKQAQGMGLYCSIAKKLK